MYDSPLHHLPKRAPIWGPFHTPLIGRRHARHAMAGQVLCQALAASPSPVRLITQPGDPKPLTAETFSKRQQKYLANAQPFITLFDDLALHVFRDLSAFLSRPINGQHVAYPEILALRTGSYGSLPTQKLNITASPKHFLHLWGPQDLLAAYPEALTRTAYFWAETLEALPTPTHSDQPDGFWPSFTPISPLPSARLEAVNTTLEHLGRIATNNTGTLRIRLTALTPDADRANKKPTLHIHGNTHQPSKDIKRWIMKHLLHPNFPLQARDWLVQTTFATSTNKLFPLLADVRIDPGTAHDYINAKAALHQQFGTITLERP